MKKLELKINQKTSLQYLPDKKIFIITDENLLKLYKKEFLGYSTIVIPSGEASKKLDTVEKIYAQLSPVRRQAIRWIFKRGMIHFS